MNRTVNAIFENGVFRPTEPVALSDGAHVEITVHTSETVAEHGVSAAGMLARLAALPIEGDADPFSGAEHDAILYGKDGAR